MSPTTLESVRAVVRRELEILGYSSQAPIGEAVLLREHGYWGHRFIADRWSLVWQVGSDSLQLFNGTRPVKKITLMENLPASEAA